MLKKAGGLALAHHFPRFENGNASPVGAREPFVLESNAQRCAAKVRIHR
jgi:hypothetical protein